MTTTKTTAPFRLIWGWSAYRDFDTLAAALAERDRIAPAVAMQTERDSLIQLPAVYVRDADGHFLLEVTE